MKGELYHNLVSVLKIYPLELPSQEREARVLYWEEVLMVANSTGYHQG